QSCGPTGMGADAGRARVVADGSAAGPLGSHPASTASTAATIRAIRLMTPSLLRAVCAEHLVERDRMQVALPDQVGDPIEQAEDRRMVGVAEQDHAWFQVLGCLAEQVVRGEHL